MLRSVGWVGALPWSRSELRRFGMMCVIALMSGVIFGAMGSLAVVALAMMGLLLLNLFVFRQDVILAASLVVISVLLDWYELFWPDHYFPLLTTALAGLLIGIRFLTQSPEHPWITIPQLRWWGGLLILGAVPILWSVSLLEGVQYYLNIFVNALLLCVVGMLVVRRIAHLRWLLSLIAAFGTLVAIHSLIYVRFNVFLLSTSSLQQYLADRGEHFEIFATSTVRAGSFLLNPDFNGAFLAPMVFLPVGLFFASSSLLTKSISAIEVLVLLLGLLSTYSLASLLAVGVGCLVFIGMVARGRYLWFTAGGLGAALLGVVVVFPRQVALFAQHASTPGEFTLRLGLWETALRVIAARPLTGLGLGLHTYLLYAEPYRVPLQYRPYAQPHNSYLEIGAMAGAPVLVLFVLILGRSLWYAWRSYRRAMKVRWPHAALLASGISAVLVICINSLAINDWTLPPQAALGWLLVGAISSPALAQQLTAALTKSSPVRQAPGAARARESAEEVGV